MEVRTRGIFMKIFMVLVFIPTACFFFQSCSSGGGGDGADGVDGGDIVETDTAAPVPGGGGAITVTNITGDSLTLTWTEAADGDRATAREDLEYLAFYSAQGNIDNTVNAENNGTPVGDWEAGIASTNVTGLSEETPYWFNVVVRDGADNRASYTMVTADTVDGTPPEVSGCTPEDGEEMVLVNRAVTVTFNEPMDGATLGGGTISLDPSVNGSVSYDAGTYTATFSPSGDLDPGVEYTVEVGTGAEDEAGNGLAAVESWTFATEEYIYRVSVRPDGTEANEGCFNCSINADGRYVAFHSSADTLVPGDTNECTDVFVCDTLTGEISRVSVSSEGTPGNDDSYEPAISADGRYVAFGSDADNLVPEDTNGSADVFVHDTQTGETVMVSVDAEGNEGTGYSGRPRITSDGRYVSFYSFADDLVQDDDNGSTDVFMHDTASGVTTLISVAHDGTGGNGNSVFHSMSADGRYVAFESFADNIVEVDTNGTKDVFVRDTQTDSTTMVSVASDGSQGNFSSGSPSISGGGRYVAFSSDASNFVDDDTNFDTDVFVHDTQTGTTTRVSVASDGSGADGSNDDPSISSDGRYVTFGSDADNLVPEDDNGYDDVFVHDTQTGETVRVSVDSNGDQANDDSVSPSISGDGRYVAFQSEAGNLIPGDKNGYSDVFRVLNR